MRMWRGYCYNEYVHSLQTDLKGVELKAVEREGDVEAKME
jgi:hypothetical protein